MRFPSVKSRRNTSSWCCGPRASTRPKRRAAWESIAPPCIASSNALGSTSRADGGFLRARFGRVLAELSIQSLAVQPEELGSLCLVAADGAEYAQHMVALDLSEGL